MTDEILTPPPTTFFRFPDEATGMAYLRGAGLIWLDENDTEHFFTSSHIHALDVLGTITRGGEWDEDGTVITPPEILPGWHVNYQGEVPDGWDAYAVYPESPVRVWA